MNRMNTHILAVDDEEAILQVYIDILGKRHSQADSIIARRMGGTQPFRHELEYEIFLARSGIEALQIVENEVNKGNHFAAGFFDMKMPGGMDGLETIRQVKLMDPDMLVAVVTAYTDHSVEQIGSLFKSQDEWIYFNKPFTHGELKQTALHLVTYWNRQKEIKQAMRAIRQTASIIKQSRKFAEQSLKYSEELVRMLPKEEHLEILLKWTEQESY